MSTTSKTRAHGFCVFQMSNVKQKWLLGIWFSSYQCV